MMICITKKVVTSLATMILLLNAMSQTAFAKEAKNLRNAKHNDVYPQGSEQEHDSAAFGERQLSTVYSCEYKYQKMKFCWKGIIPWYCYRDTEYRWCVEDTQYDCFPSTIGQNEFWDNDRIKLIGSNCMVGTSCSSRTDIGSDSSCSKDSSYKDWTGTACGGKDFDVYQC